MLMNLSAADLIRLSAVRGNVMWCHFLLYHIKTSYLNLSNNKLSLQFILKTLHTKHIKFRGLVGSVIRKCNRTKSGLYVCLSRNFTKSKPNPNPVPQHEVWSTDNEIWCLADRLFMLSSLRDSEYKPTEVSTGSQLMIPHTPMHKEEPVTMVISKLGI